MGLKKTISTAVDTIFTTLSDLTKVGTLAGKVATTFDFAGRGPAVSTSTASVKFIELSSEVEEDGSLKKELLFKASSLDPSLYSTITYESKTFRFESVSLYESAYIIVARSG